jgi:hypothetical protein
MNGARRLMLGVVAAIAVVTTPVASAAGDTLITATTANSTALAIAVGRYGLVAVKVQRANVNTQAPLTVTLDATNGRQELILMSNFGELDVTAFTISQSMTSTLGAASAITSYCAGGSSGGSFASIGVCAGGGTLTRAVAGGTSTRITVTIPAGTTREFQVAVQSPASGKDNTVTISVSVAGDGVKSGAPAHA